MGKSLYVYGDLLMNGTEVIGDMAVDRTALVPSSLIYAFRPVPVQWVSVLPTGPLGDVVYASGAKAGVDMSHIHHVEVRRLPAPPVSAPCHTRKTQAAH